MTTNGWIGRWPIEISRFDVGDIEVELATVARLESLLDRERLLRDDTFEPPYWALVWSGSVRLAGWMSRRDDLRGATVLDVGCGLGLIAMVAAHAGARVTAVDRDPEALAFLEQSAERAGLAIERLVGDVEQVLEGRRFDVVVAAELLYERSAFEALADALLAAVAPGGRLYVADAFRVDTRTFYEALERRGATPEREETVRIDEEGTTVRVRMRVYSGVA